MKRHEIERQDILHVVGRVTLNIASQVGGISTLMLAVVRRIFPVQLDRQELLQHLVGMGTRSMGVVSVTALFAGAIMVIQAAPLVERFNAKDIVGWGAGYATLREIGPLLIALIFNGRVGAQNTAELATMTATDQIVALRALAIDPISYLILPRVLAIIATLFCLTVIGDAIALGGAVIAADILLDVEPRAFFAPFLALSSSADLWSGLTKSIFFGVIIAMCSCHFGLTVQGGAPGVGRAVRSSVVASASAMFVCDYFVTYVLG